MTLKPVLKDGLYHIRFVPASVHPPFKGGLFATATELGEPILAEVGHAQGLQTWAVKRNDNGKYIITQPGFKSGLPGHIGITSLGWGLAKPSEVNPGGNILFSVNFVELEVEPDGGSESLMYGLKIPNPKGIHSGQLNVDFYVTERDHTLISQPFLSEHGSGRPHPNWQFIPAEHK